MANKMTKLIFIGLAALIIFFSIFYITQLTAQNTPPKILPQQLHLAPSRVLPKIVSTEAIEFNNVYASQSNEIYFTRAKKNFSESQLWLAKYVDSKLVTHPIEIAELGSRNTSDIHLSPDEKHLFFVIEADSPSGKSQIYKVAKQGDSWKELKKVQLTSEQASKDTYYPNTSINGNLYFSQRNETSSLDIYRAEKTKNGYAIPVKLPKHINTDKLESDAFIAPDESYLIFSRMHGETGKGMSDLYISFNVSDAKSSVLEWSTPINMSIYNTKFIEGSAFVASDGVTLLFTSNRGANKADDFDGSLDIFSAKFDIEFWKHQLK